MSSENGGKQFEDALFGKNLQERAAELAQQRIDTGVSRAKAIAAQILATGMGKGPALASQVYDLLAAELQKGGVNADAFAALALAAIPLFQQVRDDRGIATAHQMLAGFTMIIEGGISDYAQ